MIAAWQVRRAPDHERHARRRSQLDAKLCGASTRPCSLPPLPFPDATSAFLFLLSFSKDPTRMDLTLKFCHFSSTSVSTPGFHESPTAADLRILLRSTRASARKTLTRVPRRSGRPLELVGAQLGSCDSHSGSLDPGLFTESQVRSQRLSEGLRGQETGSSARSLARK